MPSPHVPSNIDARMGDTSADTRRNVMYDPQAKAIGDVETSMGFEKRKSKGSEPTGCDNFPHHEGVGLFCSEL